MKKPNPEKIILSRTDNIGDVMLSLPMAGLIKTAMPGVQVVFLGKRYTRDLIERSHFVDEFLDWEALGSEGLAETGASAIVHVFPNKGIAQAAKQASIALRIGTGHRLYHWWTCNRRVPLGRKNSQLHEAQLNLKLLAPLGIDSFPSLQELPSYYGWESQVVKPEAFRQWLDPQRFNLIFHMKSKGSAREWPVARYADLAKALPTARFNILLSGTAEEGERFRKEHPEIIGMPHVTDISGQFDLSTFIDFVQSADGLLACSTGPLHIAAASGIATLGLYPCQRPMHAGRWAPLGTKATWIEEKEAEGEHLNISMEEVRQQVSLWAKA